MLCIIVVGVGSMSLMKSVRSNNLGEGGWGQFSSWIATIICMKRALLCSRACSDSGSFFVPGCVEAAAAQETELA